jgi:hypothetical protein
MYNSLIQSSSLSSVQIPETFLPAPSDTDYTDGKIKRYFIQKANDKISPVFEISESTYNDLLTNVYWSKVELNWRIVGKLEPVYSDKGMLIDPGVANSNIKEIAKFQKTIPTLKNYLINTLQFYKPYRI